MSISQKELLNFLEKKFPQSKINVIDNNGIGESFSIYIKSAKFNEVSRINRHRLVMDVLKEMLEDKIHAVSLKLESR